MEVAAADVLYVFVGEQLDQRRNFGVLLSGDAKLVVQVEAPAVHLVGLR